MSNRFPLPRLSEDGGRAEALASLARTAAFYRAQRIAPLRELEERYLVAKDLIRQVHPNEKIDAFGSMEGIEKLYPDELDKMEEERTPLVNRIEARASEVRAEAEKIRAENLTEVESLRRDFEYLATRVAKLESAQPGRQPSLPHTRPRDSIPQILGMPGGMRRHTAAAPVSGSGVRRVRAADETAGSVAAAAPATPGFARRPHPLDVIGPSG
jgi:hypothetical protein